MLAGLMLGKKLSNRFSKKVADYKRCCYCYMCKCYYYKFFTYRSLEGKGLNLLEYVKKLTNDSYKVIQMLQIHLKMTLN